MVVRKEISQVITNYGYLLVPIIKKKNKNKNKKQNTFKAGSFREMVVGITTAAREMASGSFSGFPVL